MDRLAYDLRLAIRALRRRPGFTAVAALTLGLGIGANTAIFTVVNGVLMRPLPYEEPERLVMVWKAPEEPGAPPGVMSYPDIADLEERSPSLDSLVGFSASTITLTGMGEPLLLDTTRLSRGLMSTFGARPALGRDIRQGEFGADAAAVVVVAHAFWRDRLGSDPAVLGRTLRLNDDLYEIVGVAPEGFDFPSGTQLWIPRQIDPEGCARGCHTWQAVGRLAAGATLGTAQAEADAIAANLSEAYPDTNFEKRFLVVSLLDQVVGDVRAGLWVLLGAVTAVLLIACANVANLMLASASRRQGEVAVRAALGAGPRRLAAGLLLESALLATFGGVLGLGLAALGVRLLRALSAGTVPRVEAVSIDAPVLLFTTALVLAVTLLFGVGPALHMARAPLVSRLTAAGRDGDAGRAGRRFRSALTAAEICVSFVLLVGAGLLLRTFGQMYAVDPGFETRGILRFTLSLPDARYPELEQIRAFYRTLEERVAALPGVESVGTIYGAPLGRGSSSGAVLVDGRPEPEPAEETFAAIRPVGPGYLETMRIPLRRGRVLEPADDAGGPPVAVVNEAFARQNFLDGDALGEGVRITVNMGYGSPSWRIVGIVGDVRAAALTRQPVAEIYVPHGRFGPGFMTVSVRHAPGAGDLVGAIRSEVRAMDPDLPLQNVETVAAAIGRQLAPTRFFLLGVGAFATLALTLAIVGLYGVIAYLVARRTREIGVRVALGARRPEIVRLVVLDGLRPTLPGLAAGLLLALAGGRLLEGLLYGVSARDPLILATVPALLATVAVAATLLPAARASRVDPAEALRSE